MQKICSQIQLYRGPPPIFSKLPTALCLFYQQPPPLLFLTRLSTLLFSNVQTECKLPNYQNPFWFSESFVQFSIIQTLYLQKTKPSYPHPKYLFGIGICIWATKNQGFSLRVSEFWVHYKIKNMKGGTLIKCLISSLSNLAETLHS